MSNFKGYATLTSPADLLGKLLHDFARMEQEPGNPYPAFDFFVTAEHILDWLYPGSPSRRKEERQKEPLLRVTSHLATGAKHFIPTASHHKSVNDLRVEGGAFDARDYESEGFETGYLVVELQGNEATDIGQQITAVELARRVLEHWQKELGPYPPKILGIPVC